VGIALSATDGSNVKSNRYRYWIAKHRQRALPAKEYKRIDYGRLAVDVRLDTAPDDRPPPVCKNAAPRVLCT
jgi:hypothetical protein